MKTPKPRNKEKDLPAVTQQVKKWQSDHGLTNEQMATKLGCHWLTYAHIRAGTKPSKKMLAKMSHVLQSQ